MRTQTQDMAAKRTRRDPSPTSIAMHNALAANLRLARAEAGLTQVSIGELADVSKDYMLDWSAIRNLNVEGFPTCPPFSLCPPMHIRKHFR